MFPSPMNPILPWLSLWSKENAEPASLPPGPVFVDVEGLSLEPAEFDRLRHPLVGGVILFARNYESPEQLQELTQQIREARTSPIVIAVDQEGGRVQRFRQNGFTALPSMQAIGEYWDENPLWAMRAASEVGYVLAAELRACGVDFSFAPCLDLNYGVSTVIGSRSFHADQRVVSMLARSLIQGMAAVGMGACGKHFPGHGYVDADSHVALPVDTRRLEEILENDAMPYEWLSDMLLTAVMPAHVIYEKVDSMTAGFSKIWIQKILRQRLNYQGVVFSDDLTMEGAAIAGDIVARAQAALGAGCDMVLVCNRPDLADQLLAQLDYRMSAESLKRIRRLIPSRSFMNWEQLQAESRYQNARNFQSKLFS